MNNHETTPESMFRVQQHLKGKSLEIKVSEKRKPRINYEWLTQKA